MKYAGVVAYLFTKLQHEYYEYYIYKYFIKIVLVSQKIFSDMLYTYYTDVFIDA